MKYGIIWAYSDWVSFELHKYTQIDLGFLTEPQSILTQTLIIEIWIVIFIVEIKCMENLIFGGTFLFGIYAMYECSSYIVT